MTVSASFLPEHVAAVPGQPTTLTLLLRNEAPEERTVKLRAAGDLATQTVLQSETILLDPNETFEVPVVVDPGLNVPAGPHRCSIEVADGELNSVADATVEIGAAFGFDLAVEPPASRSARAGRHKVAVTNTGNVPLVVELGVAAPDSVVAELAAPIIDVGPAATTKVELRLTPTRRFWNGAREEHPFTVTAVASDGEQAAADGVFDQGPRLRAWVAPALAGAAIALLLGALAWFALLRPAVENIADDRAAVANQAERDELDAKITELEVAAAEAEELPLGEPTDQRLTVAPAEGDAQTATFPFDPSGGTRVLSITDVVFQNPSGANGRVQLLRGSGDDAEVLLESDLANFRDLDFHLVAPFRFESGSAVGLRVECLAAGPAADGVCDVSATLLGFVDG